MILLIISTLSFLYIMLQFNYATFIHISFSHSFKLSYLSLFAFLNHDKKAPHSSFSCSFQHQKKQTIYPRWGSWLQSQYHTRQLQWSLRWQFRIRRQATSATSQERHGQLPIKRYLHIDTWKMSRSNSFHSYRGSTATSWVPGGV